MKTVSSSAIALPTLTRNSYKKGTPFIFWDNHEPSSVTLPFSVG